VPLLFSEQTYDLRPNLEGDVAGYLVARNPAAGDRLSRVQAPSFVSVARALEDYAREPDWADRWARFARLLGAPPGLRAGSLLRRQELLARVRRQTLRFAACYLLYRLRHLGRLSRATLFEASRHVEGAATELAELFLAVLEQGLGQGPEQNLVPAAARDLPDLPASPPRPPGGLLALGTLGSRVWG
jgi:hypothetical protein